MCVYIYLFTNFLSTCGASRVAGLNQILDKQFLHAPSQIICMLYFKTPSLRLLDPQLYMLLQLGNIDQPSLFSNNPKFMTCRTFVSFIFIHVLDNKTHFPFSLPSSVFFVKEICLWGRIDPPLPHVRSLFCDLIHSQVQHVQTIIAHMTWFHEYT